MAEFVVKFNQGTKEVTYLNKLELNFSVTNAKNILLTKDLTSFETKENIYALIKMTPIFPNIPFYVFLITTLIYLVFLFFNKNLSFLFWFIGVFFVMSMFWTKYFYYLILRNSIRKFGFKARLL